MKDMRRLAILSLWLAAAALAQPLDVGIKGGVPVSEGSFQIPYSKGGGRTTLNRYTVGPTAEFGLPLGLTFEADLLYKHSHSAGAARFGLYPIYYAVQQANSWELPLLAKYRFLRGPISPYVVAGPSLHWVRAHIVTRTTTLGATGETTTSAATSQNYYQTGLSAGGGVGVKIGRIRLSPELRYTHWSGNELDLNPFPSEHHADVLLGITF